LIIFEEVAVEQLAGSHHHAEDGLRGRILELAATEFLVEAVEVMDLAAKPLLEIAEQLLTNEFALGGLEVGDLVGHGFTPLNERGFGDANRFRDLAIGDAAGTEFKEFGFEFGRVLHIELRVKSLGTVRSPPKI
jgi:hypothetical protein